MASATPALPSRHSRLLLEREMGNMTCSEYALSSPWTDPEWDFVSLMIWGEELGKLLRPDMFFDAALKLD